VQQLLKQSIRYNCQHWAVEYCTSSKWDWVHFSMWSGRPLWTSSAMQPNTLNGQSTGLQTERIKEEGGRERGETEIGSVSNEEGRREEGRGSEGEGGSKGGSKGGCSTVTEKEHGHTE
jgi:hypothetical protein